MITRDAIAEEARRWIGTPYAHQQSRFQVGCDCLGFVRGIWRNVLGVEPAQPPAYSQDWAEASGRETMLQAARLHMNERPISAMDVGDVLLFRWRPHLPAKHCAILVETPHAGAGRAGRIVHAYDSAGRVVEGHLAVWEERIVSAFSFPGLARQEGEEWQA